jgi:hypothetical protein
MDPDQTARMRRLVWIHAGRKRTMLVLSWRGSYNYQPSKSDACCVYKSFLRIKMQQNRSFQHIFP